MLELKMERTMENKWDMELDAPVRAGLKVIRIHDPNQGMTDEEIEDRNEFIRCYLLKDFEPMLRIPQKVYEDDFFMLACCVESFETSAFNTHDFERLLRPFNRYEYAMKKIMEKVEDLAIMHSCILDPEGKNVLYNRFEAFIEDRFVGRLVSLHRRYRYTENDHERMSIKKKVSEINRRILECRSIWEQYSLPE